MLPDRSPDLARRPWSRRGLTNRVLTGLALAAAFLALVPLFSVLWTIIRRGTEQWTWSMIVELPPAGREEVGGFGNALVGTFAMVGMAALIVVPLGMLAGIWLAEFGRESLSASALRFAMRTMSGLPSILAGLLAYALIIATFKTYRPVAGAVALSLLMLPTIVLATEQALLQVVAGLRESAQALGATRWQVTRRVVLPAARSGIVTGILLAVARACGETAPLIFTALSSPFWMRNLREPTQSLAVQVYEFARRPYENQLANAWSTALALMVVVLALNVTCCTLARRDRT